jgi:hypothetical protein
MARDARLDLGRYIRNPFNKNSANNKKLDFDDLFRSKPETGDYPWNPSRFDQVDLVKRAMTRKVTLNPDLNFVGNAPFFDNNQEVTPEYELFAGLGRFKRLDYDFEEGRPKTFQRPQDQPDFNPQWVEAYKLSPTLNPEDRARNPMPRLRNPDPNGYLMTTAESRAKNEIEDNKSVADLLTEDTSASKKEKEKEDREGEELATQTEQDTGVKPMTT